MTQTYSSVLEDMLSDVRVISEGRAIDTNLRVYRDVATVPNSANNDTVILKPISVDAVIETMEVTLDDLGTTGTIDIGVFRIVSGGGTVSFEAIDANCLASGLDATQSVSSAVAPQRFNGLSADAIDKRLWEIAGLTEKPSYGEFYLGLTTTTGTTTAGTVTVVAGYSL